MKQRNTKRYTNTFRDGDGNISVQVGDVITWSTLGGKSFAGEIINLDGNVALVKLDDSTEISVEL